MSEHNKQSGRGFRHHSKKQHNQKDLPASDMSNPLIAAFHGYSKLLDDKHDRYERIVKLSRDITIESKRIIFLLHTVCPRKNNKEIILADAEIRLQKLVDVNFLAIAKELTGQDVYQYKWAFSAGLQEFIEALTFHQYLQGNDSIVDWNELQSKMTYKVFEENSSKRNDTITDKIENEDEVAVNGDSENFENIKEPVSYKFFVEPTEYVLGVADLTGELMRRCINSLGSGDTGTSFECCKTLQDFYKSYISINAFRCKELSRKIYTMKQSVLKTENVCYNVKVRGGEAAKWGAVSSGYDAKDDVDEGFY